MARHLTGESTKHLALILSTLPILLFACRHQSKDDAIPIRFAPGETVTLQRAPANGSDVFALAGTAGQTLRLEVVNVDCPQCGPPAPGSLDSLRVFLDGAKAELPSRFADDDCRPWHWMNLLPSSGVFTSS